MDSALGYQRTESTDLPELMSQNDDTQVRYVDPTETDERRKLLERVRCRSPSPGLDRSVLELKSTSEEVKNQPNHATPLVFLLSAFKDAVKKSLTEDIL